MIILRQTCTSKNRTCTDMYTHKWVHVHPIMDFKDVLTFSKSSWSRLFAFYLRSLRTPPAPPWRRGASGVMPDGNRKTRKVRNDKQEPQAKRQKKNEARALKRKKDKDGSQGPQITEFYTVSVPEDAL